MALTVLQWNARSVLPKSAELEAYLNYDNSKPDVICIQETWLKDTDTFDFPGYKMFRTDRIIQDGRSKGGGVATMIKETIPSIQIDLSPHQIQELESLTVDIKMKEGKLRIINCYNPGVDIPQQPLSNFFSHAITQKTIICGDFNAHHSLWGDTRQNQRGTTLVDISQNLNLVCLNTGLPTHCNTACKTLSPLDLTFTTPNIAAKSLWEVTDLTLGSDHQLIYIFISITPQTDAEHTPNFSFKKANWDKFNKLCEQNLNNTLCNDDII